MRPLLRASKKTIASLHNNCLSTNPSSYPIPKTIDHVIPKVGRAILGPGDLNNMGIKQPIWDIEVELLFFAYLNE